MDHRYSLRFETGERQGESIPITGKDVTVGRKPGNTLQILDNSVSGKHAELIVDEQGVLLRDLGSTNGTRVGTQRVLEQRLAHGDQVLFGNVRLVFQDARVGGASRDGSSGPAAARDPARDSAAGSIDAPMVRTAVISGVGGADGVDRVSSALIAKAKKRSFAGGLVVLGLLAVGAGLWLWLNGRGAQGPVQANRPVEPVAGNLLAGDFSFEADSDGWTAVEGSPAAFLRTGAARRSGAFGVEADLGAGEWALHRSKDLRANVDRTLTARAFLRTRGDVEARLGIEFYQPETPGAPFPGPILAWAEPVRAAQGFVESTLAAAAPPGYSNARVVLLARSIPGSGENAGGAGGGSGGGTGSVFADDVSVVEDAAAAKAVAALEGASFFLHGSPATSAHLFKVDRVLLSSLEFTRGGARSGFEGVELAAHVEGAKILVERKGQGACDALVLRAEAPLVRGGIATVGRTEGENGNGAGGYRRHDAEFERADVESILLGGGADLVRIQLDKPCAVKGVAEGGASRITITCGSPPEKVALQLAFSEERRQAGDIAHAARNAEQKRDLGAALKAWAQLLDSYPYEEALVDEAEKTRARLVQKGLEELRVVQGEAERARFFRLADLFRQCREKARAVGARYAGSEVESESKKLADEVTNDLAGLEADLNKVERARMSSILAALEAQKATGLAGEVREFLATRLAPKKLEENR